MAERREIVFDDLKAQTKQAFAMGPFGSRIKAENFVTSGIPVIKGANLGGDFLVEDKYDFLTEEKANELSSSIAVPLDIVITHRGTLGQVGIIRENSLYPRYIVSQSQLKLTFDQSKINPYFAYYFLHSSEGQRRLLMNASQVGVPAIAQALTSVRAIKILLPSRNEQDEIVSLLLALDDRIELTRQTNKTLEAMARLFFKDWFIDFGPTRAKAEGCPPYLAPELWALFPDVLDDDDKPLGWRIGELQEIVVMNPSEPLPRGQVALYLEMASLPTSGPISKQPVKRIFSSGMRFRNGDTLFARITPCLENGKAAFVQNLPPNTIGWGSTEFIVMRSRPPIPKPYSYILAREPAFRAHAIRSMTGTSGRQRARTEAIAQYPITIPTEAVWQAFGSIVDPMFEHIRANGEETQTLVELRDLLLPKLMSGEISLCEAEKLVEQVA